MIPVTFSERAIHEVKLTLASKKIPSGYGLRVGVRGGGCAGVSYILGFDEKSDNDLTFEVQGVQVYMEKKDVMHLIGMKVDFYEGNDARGFTFVNSNEQQQSF